MRTGTQRQKCGLLILFVSRRFVGFRLRCEWRYQTKTGHTKSLRVEEVEIKHILLPIMTEIHPLLIRLLIWLLAFLIMVPDYHIKRDHPLCWERSKHTALAWSHNLKSPALRLFSQSGADHRKHQSSASLASVWEIYRWSVNSPHKWSVARRMFPYDEIIMPCDVPYRHSNGKLTLQR